MAGRPGVRHSATGPLAAHSLAGGTSGGNCTHMGIRDTYVHRWPVSAVYLADAHTYRFRNADTRYFRRRVVDPSYLARRSAL